MNCGDIHHSYVFKDKGWLFTFCTILPTKGGNIQVCTFYFVWQGVWNCGDIHHCMFLQIKGENTSISVYVLPTKNFDIQMCIAGKECGYWQYLVFLNSACVFFLRSYSDNPPSM